MKPFESWTHLVGYVWFYPIWHISLQIMPNNTQNKQQNALDEKLFNVQKCVFLYTKNKRCHSS